MRKEKVIAGVLGVTMVLVLLGVGGIIWNASRSNKSDKASVKSVQTPIVESSGGLSVGDNTGLGAGIDGTQAQGLDSGSSGTSQQKSTKQEDFSSYDKYKDSKSALFAEVKKGEGQEVKAQSVVSIYYIGRLTDGSIFDNQWPAKVGDKPKPFEFTIGTDKIITGLQQGMVGMKVGGTRRIIIPPSVGYGDKGQGSIPPSSVLVFDVELLESK